MAAVTCLFCDRPKILDVVSVAGRRVPICATHWLVYASSKDNPIRKGVEAEIRKHERDDRVLTVEEVLNANGFRLATDEEVPKYKTTEERKG